MAMSWRSNKREPFQRTRTGVSAKKNGIKFQISDYTKGFSVEHLGWYVFVEDTKLKKNYNSLWKNLWYENIDEAKQWCEDFKWESVKEG